MSRNRTMPEAGWAQRRALPRGPNGRCLCRRCGQEVPRGRRTFCGDACVHEWRLRSDPGYLRQQVSQRDHGVCALCGLDCQEFGQAVRELEHRWGWWGPGYALLQSLNLGSRRTFWDADHIVPVAEGGGECDLSNLRTLCWRCHKRETARLRRRLAGKPQELPVQHRLPLEEN